MTEIRYVNVHGFEIDPHKTESARAPKKVRATSSGMTAVTDKSVATHFMGFVVTGWSPQHLIDAEEEHGKSEVKRRAECEEKRREFIPKPWNEESHMRIAKPHKVRSKPYELREAADLCAEMAIKSGWKSVSVTKVMKSDGSKR